MPKQINSDYIEASIPFSNMTFSPDTPSAALQPNEYNDGLNVETDVRGIRSVAGDLEILQTVPGTPTFISSGFRKGTPNGSSNEYWFIVATTEGNWYAGCGIELTGISPGTYWYDITPGGTPIVGYAQNTNITESWNGSVVFFNDTVGAPMFLPESNDTVPYPILVQYSNLVKPAGIDDIVFVSAVPSVYRIILDDAYDAPPYIAGQQIVITDINNYFNGIYTVVTSTTTTIDYLYIPSAAYPGNSVGTVSPAYSWNYNPNWKSYYANFMRMYSTPNVGSILVAGNLTVTNLDDTIDTFPVTVQWSQAFGLNEAPNLWEPTITNVANQLEVPLRGPALDAFPCNGQFFLCSYWDTVVFSPINYSTTSAPILGVRLYNQGRGLLSSNCWANTDKLVYGVDARDIWVFDGTNFDGLGNQRVKNWFFDQLDPQYYDRVYMEVNSQKNQVEIYYPDSQAIDGVPNKMLSYRYDLQVWNAPRDVDSATFSCESPIWLYYNTYNNVAPTGGAGTGSKFNVSWDLDVGTTYDVVLVNGGSGYAVSNTLTIDGDVLGGVTSTNDVVITVTGVDMSGKITAFSYTGLSNPQWYPNLGSRTVVYAKGQTSEKIVQKDYGYEIKNAAIASYFKRSNIKLIKDYSGKLMVHRLLPEAVNLGGIPFSSNYNKQLPESTGNISVQVDGADSVGQLPVETTDFSMTLNTDNPWLQMDQNRHRVNTITLSNTSNSHIWLCSATTWQYTQTEDDR